MIHAYAKSSEPGSSERTLELLREMESEYAEGNSNMRPSAYTYNMVISSLAKSRDQGAAQRAEELLQLMEEKSSEGRLDLKPDVVTYSSGEIF